VAVVAVAADDPPSNVCLFFHGAGEDGPANGAIMPENQFVDYWGQVHDVVKDVCDPRFFHADTRTQGWDDMNLMKAYCHAIITTNPFVIITHSMGNVIIAGGIANNLPGCQRIGMQANKVAWFGSGAPLKGSPAADAVSGLCSLPVVGSISSHYCDGNGNAMAAYVSLGEQYKSPTNPQVQLSGTQCDHSEGCVTISHVASNKMMGLMCGMNPAAWLDNSSRGTLLTALAGLVGPHWSGDQNIAYPTSGNDGMVPFANSCKLLGKRFDQVPTSSFYAVDGNHNAVTCADGDNTDSDTQKPCEWIKNMFMRAKPSGRQGTAVGPDSLGPVGLGGALDGVPGGAPGGIMTGGVAAAVGSPGDIITPTLLDESARVRHRLRKHRAMPTKKRAPHHRQQSAAVGRRTTTSPRRSW